MKVSIIIPAYEAHGEGVMFLTELLDSINSQTYRNIEIIISDHSKNKDIEDFCKKTYDHVIHFYNERGRGNSSVNMNEGIKKASGDIIKIMHLDDIFCNNEAVQRIVDAVGDRTVKWGAFAFNHNHVSESVVKNEIKPKMYYNGVMDAESLIGCPSVSFFANDDNFFDENMIIINDFDMHYRLREKYGPPFMIKEVSITVRIHAGQVTNALETYKEKEKEEMEYFKIKK